VVGRPEILADGEDVENLTATVACDASRGRRDEDRHTGREREGIRGNGLYGRRSRGISLETVGSAVCRAVVEEWVQVWRIEVDAEAAANDEISLAPNFVRKSHTRRE